MKLQNGVKKRRQISALERLEKQLQSGIKNFSFPTPDGKRITETSALSDKDITRIKREIQTLKSSLQGIKKTRVSKTTSEPVEVKKNHWVIDIFSIKYGYENKAAKRQAGKVKGSRKKMKRVKRMTLVKSVSMIPGILQKYKDGVMGISPKHHVFKARNTEVEYN